jgi:hypothetical protein
MLACRVNGSPEPYEDAWNDDAWNDDGWYERSVSVSNGSADEFWNRGAIGLGANCIWLGGGTSAPEPKAAEKVGIGREPVDGNSTFSSFSL